LEGAPAPPPDGQNPVTSPPAIVSVPSTRSVARGGTTTLFVSASGENLAFQWKKNGQNIAGATSSALALENATGADAGQYVVQVTNPNGVVSSQAITVTVKMPVVPAGVYRINNSAGNPGHEVALTSFSIDQHEVTKAFWDEVYTWAIANGYDFSNAGIAEGPEYPVHSINWYDCIKWANALSERDGHTPCYYTDNNCTVIYRAGQVDLTNYNVKWNANGYRLPTETEWEVAARGGLVGSKYAWGESPSTTRANFDQTLHGATIPVGSFPANGYGLYEIGGNLREWTWDWNDSRTYEYDFNETFELATGFNGLVESSQTNAIYLEDLSAYVPGNPIFGIGNEIIRNNGNEELYGTYNFEANTSISRINFSARRHGSSSFLFKIIFTYQDNQTATEYRSYGSTYTDGVIANPYPEKYVKNFVIRTSNPGRFKNVIVHSNREILAQSTNEVFIVPSIDGTNWIKAKELDLSSEYVHSVDFEVKEQISGSWLGDGEVIVEFLYSDGSDSNSSTLTVNSTSYGYLSHGNPSQDKKVSKIRLYIRSNYQGNGCDLRDVKVNSHLTSDISHVTFKIPQYFEVQPKIVRLDFFNQMYQWVYNEKDAFKFSFIDHNNTEAIYNYEQVGKLIDISKKILNPKYFRVYMKPRYGATSSETALFGINLQTDNPKSWNVGNYRILRDNHYAEALENLGKRTFSTPDRRYSTVGFRLVQRR
jgi:formylglycine-generating enzyme required for sulfatase activity